MAEPSSSSASKEKEPGSFLLGGMFRYVNKESKDRVYCTVCEKVFKYHHSSTSLRYHYENLHPCSTPKGDGGKAKGDKKKDEKEKKQTSIGMFTNRPVSTEKRLALNNAIAAWLARSGRPLYTTEDSGLKDLLCLALGSDDYAPPSHQTITRRVEDMYARERKSVDLLLQSTDHVAVTADYWTSHGNDSYLGLTGHVITDDWCLKSRALTVALSTERHFSDNVKTHIEDACKEWGIRDRLVSLGVDNARNMLAAGSRLEPPVTILPCAAHTLQIAVRKAIAQSGTEVTLAKLRKIVGHVKHSPANLRELQVLQKQEGEDVERLVSTFACLKGTSYSRPTYQ